MELRRYVEFRRVLPSSYHLKTHFFSENCFLRFSNFKFSSHCFFVHESDTDIVFFFKLASRQGCIFYFIILNTVIYIIFCLAGFVRPFLLNPFLSSPSFLSSQRLLFPPSVWVVASQLMPPVGLVRCGSLLLFTADASRKFGLKKRSR